jgi:hypothetical protein
MMSRFFRLRRTGFPFDGAGFPVRFGRCSQECRIKSAGYGKACGTFGESFPLFSGSYGKTGGAAGNSPVPRPHNGMEATRPYSHNFFRVFSGRRKFALSARLLEGSLFDSLGNSRNKSVKSNGLTIAAGAGRRVSPWILPSTRENCAVSFAARPPGLRRGRIDSASLGI